MPGSDTLAVLLVILVIVVVVRGPKTLPKLGAALGRTVREAREEASKKLDDSPSEGDPPA
jgi:TatA/E family protein of Tat protein translocase